MVTIAYMCILVHGQAGFSLVVNLAELLEEIILPSFLSYYPRPSLSPPFDLHIFPVSCALEREDIDSRGEHE